MSLVKQLRRFGRRFDDCASLRVELECLREENERLQAIVSTNLDFVRIAAAEAARERMRGERDEYRAAWQLLEPYAQVHPDELDRLHRIEAFVWHIVNGDVNYGVDQIVYDAARAVLVEEA